MKGRKRGRRQQRRGKMGVLGRGEKYKEERAVDRWQGKVQRRGKSRGPEGKGKVQVISFQ